jgi:ribosomal protein L11 methylase PrmA
MSDPFNIDSYKEAYSRLNFARKILGDEYFNGKKVADLGCGSGHFSI